MFRESWNARYVLRAVLVAAIALLASLKASLGDGIDTGEWIDAGTTTLGALGAYLGLGAAFGPVEPFVGRKLEGAAVPEPPANPEPPA